MLAPGGREIHLDISNTLVLLPMIRSAINTDKNRFL